MVALAQRVAYSRHKLHTFISRVIVCLALLTISIADSLAEPTDLHREVRFQIASQPLDTALIEFSRQARVPVSINASSLDAIKAPAIKGTLPVATALSHLLGGTRLSYAMVGNTVAVAPADAVSTSQRSATVEGRSTEAVRNGAEDSGNRLEEVVVTAQKREERLQNVPIAITVLGGSQLENPTVASAADALNTVAGVAANQAYLGGGTLVTVRGVSTGLQTISGSSPVAYYLDSVPFGLVKSAVAPDQNVYDLQRIEVLRGPQGTLYGASALNGVVRILTQDANLDDFEGKVRGSDSGTSGGGNSYRADAALNVPIVEGKLAARAVVGYEKLSGWIDTPIKNDTNDAQLRNYRLKINAQPTETFSVDLSLWSTRDDYGAPNNAGDHDHNSSVFNQPIETNFDAYAMKMGYAFSGYLLQSMTSYLSYNNDSNLDFTSLLGFPFTLFTGLDSNVFAEEVLLNSPVGGGWRWSVGGMYRRAIESRFQYISLLDPVTGLFADVRDRSESYTGFGEVTRTLLDGRLEATLGVRQFEDHVTQRGRSLVSSPLLVETGDFHATTPRAVLTWHAKNTLTLYASYSQGFRSGFPQDVSVPAGLPPVKPDKLSNYEAGSKGSLWDGRVVFDTAVYYMKWKDAQQTLQVPVGNVYTTAVVNGQSASGLGVDIGLSVQPIKGLVFGINGSWNDLGMDRAVISGGVALFQKGDRLNYSPQTTAGASASYNFPLGASNLVARISAAANYTSSQRFVQNAGGSVVLVGKGDSMLVGRVGFAVESPEHWTATLFVNNVTNEDGAVVRPFEVPDLYTRVRPRTTGVQLEYRFK